MAYLSRRVAMARHGLRRFEAVEAAFSGVALGVRRDRTELLRFVENTSKRIETNSDLDSRCPANIEVMVKSYKELPITACIVALVVSIGGAVIAQVALQSTFADVDHPVALSQANLTTDAATARGYLDVLQDQGTLGQMVRTELVDFAWIAALMSGYFFITLTVGKLLQRRNATAGSRLVGIAPFIALIPGIDALENTLSLSMLADPENFPDWLATAHGGVSWTKAILAVVVPASLVLYTIVGAIGGGKHKQSDPAA